MILTREEVEKVAHLARLKLTDSELDVMRQQLSAILEYVDALSNVDTAGVEPLAHPLPIQNVFRGDVLGESLPRELALANAPKHDGHYFSVPPILD